MQSPDLRRGKAGGGQARGPPERGRRALGAAPPPACGHGMSRVGTPAWMRGGVTDDTPLFLSPSAPTPPRPVPRLPPQLPTPLSPPGAPHHPPALPLQHLPPSGSKPCPSPGTTPELPPAQELRVAKSVPLGWSGGQSAAGNQGAPSKRGSPRGGHTSKRAWPKEGRRTP